MQYLIVCPLVFLAGLVDSIAGGGGLISLPGYMIAGVPAHMALGTNKMSSTIGTLVSTARLLKHGYLKGKIAVAAVSAVFAMTGSVLGAQIALRVPDSVIRSMMIVILPIVAYYVLRIKIWEDSERTGTISKRRVCVISLAASFVIGTYDGFYGPYGNLSDPGAYGSSPDGYAHSRSPDQGDQSVVQYLRTCHIYPYGKCVLYIGSSRFRLFGSRPLSGSRTGGP